MGSINIDTAGRGVYNSIYYDREVSAAPGKLYDIRDAAKRTSTAMPPNGMLLPPKSASDRARRKQLQVDINTNPLTRLRRLQQRIRNDS